MQHQRFLPSQYHLNTSHVKVNQIREGEALGYMKFKYIPC